ncbi:DUF6509 family protein [Paenibacillus sp. TRM 82003]|nr:DUF6509 family protein [Paenibacillus sp. TRM 82003]
MEISAYSVERVKDPFGIIDGQRYEFFLDVEVDEEDELHSEAGLSVRVVYSVEAARERLVSYQLLERSTEKPIDLELEPEEVALLEAFCKEHANEAE